MRSGLMYPALIRPAVATLVRAARRIGPVRSCGKPVHRRNIPEALGRGGVMRYAAVLILAGIVAAASALFFTTAQAQSVITLVSNTAQSTSNTTMTVGEAGSAQFTNAQTFTTGDNAGRYTLSGVRVDIVGNTYGVDDTVRVSIYTADSDGKPDAVEYTLTNPSTVRDGLNTFTAPVGATLDAETEYAVVVEQTGSGTFAIRGTDGNDQSSDEASAGWAIRDNRWTRGSDAGAWSSYDGNLRIVVSGAAGATVIVPVDWDLIPSGLDEGDSFRLLFLSSTKHNATTTDIADYNTFIQTRAAAGHTAIQAYADEFLVVGSTQDTDARDNTDTTYTAFDKGAPIYWLNGNKVADNYEDFYDGSWSNESNANDKDESGANGPNTSQAGNYPFTGSDHDGTEAFSGNDSSRALGSSGQVQVGRPGASSEANGPLGSNTTTAHRNSRPFYGLSPVFTISDPPTPTSVIADTSGFTIHVFFDEDLDATSLSFPATVIAAFSVYADTVELTIKSINLIHSAQRDRLYIVLEPTPITQGQTVTFDYDQSVAGTDALADADGNRVLTFTDFAVTNNSTVPPPPAELVVSPTSLTVAESGSGSFTVKLATQPTANVSVAVSPGDRGAATVSPVSLTFMTSNWNTAQTVTVGGVNDSDSSNETLTVSLSASGGGYAGKTASVSVSVTDDGANDPPAFCGRTPQVQDGIIATLATDQSVIRTCATVTDADLALITSLAINRGAIRTLKSGDFAGLTMLDSLDLSYNDIETLPAGDFAGLTMLDSLDLAYNDIETLPAGLFNGLSSLRDLDISYNRLSSVEDVRDALGTHDALEILALPANQFTIVPADAFAGLSGLRELYLGRNAIISLPAGVFAGLSALEKLYLDDNHIQALDGTIFTGLTALETLRLEGNELASLPAGLFAPLTALINLKLGENPLTALHEDAFDGLTALKKLWLRNNNFTSLPVDLFDGLTSLQVLYVTESPGLTELQPGIFDGLTNLRELRIYFNGLESLHVDLFDGLDSLGHLIIDGNPYTSDGLPSTLLDSLTGLQNFTMRNTSLETLPTGFFDGLDTVKTLDLRFNQFTTLPATIFEPFDGTLNYIHLSWNDLASLDSDIFDGLPNVYQLRLNGNQLTSLPADLFADFDGSLKEVRLDENQLTSLPADLFDGLNGLQRLYLNDNDLASPLPADLFAGPDNSLSKLILTNNPGITTLQPGIFAGLEGLDDLDLSCTGLTTLDPTVFNPFGDALRYLDLSGIPFTTAPTDAELRQTLTHANLTIDFDTSLMTCLPAFAQGLRSPLRVVSSDGAWERYVVPEPHEFPLPSFTVGGWLPTEYLVTVPGTVTEITVEAFPGDPRATVEAIRGTEYDEDPVASGIQINLRYPRHEIGWSVRSRDRATRSYTLVVHRQVPLSSLPPGPPTGLSAAAVGQTRIDLAWTAPSAIGGSDISGYKIEVSSDSGSSWSDRVADTGSTGTTYPHTGLSAASTRHYRVSAINSVGAGTASGPASATTAAAPGVSVNPTMLSVNEGLTGTYTVVLNTQPGAGVTVTPRSSDTNEVTFAPASLSFTTTDWETAQTVTVTGVEDDDGKNDTAIITHTVSGYAGVFTAPSIPVTVPDNDTRGVTVTPTTFALDADESITYTVVLDTQPVGGSVTVTANVTDPANPEISVSPSRLVFTASNWSRGQTATVTSYPNADAAAMVVHTISHAVSGADYGSETAAAVMVTVTDSAVDVAAAIDLTPVAGSDAYYSSPGFALGILETVTDVNWVRVRMFETRQYRLELVMKPSLAPNLGLSWDAVIEGVYSAAGQQLAGPESQGPAGVSWEPTGSTDWFRLRQPTEYYYVAVASGGRSVGGWDLQVYHHPAGRPQESPEASADLSSPARVEVGGCFEGGMVNKRNSIDEDWIGVQLTQGVEYLIEVRAWDSGLGSLIDADLRRARFDPSDTAIADVYGDDGSVSWSSRLDQGERQEERITWTPRVSGLYFLPILNPGAFTGSYVLSVSESVDGSVDCGPTTALAVAAAVAVPVIDPVDPPARPRGLTGTVVHNAVSLNWDDPGDASITGYQILRLDRDVHGLGNFQVHVDDTGSAAASYVDTDLASETRYVYRLKARNAAGLSEWSDFFRADTPSEPEPNSPATGAPAIGGTAQVGETLTADTSGIADADGLERAVFAYQWSIIWGAASADITGATEAAYTPVDADEGLAIRVRVSFTDDGGNAETLTSAATAAVAAKPNSPATGAPVITGTAQVGETLSADTPGIADEDGLANVSYSYQWLADDADIAGATGSTYTPVDADEGVALKVRVAFTDDRGNDEGLTSAATAAVAGLPPEPLTAGFENTPSSHDGENVFTFELRFSEEIRLSYRTLRDRAFTVAGGAVSKARRMEQGSSIHWRITVKPNSGSDVSIVLPVTSDCEDRGAICAEDGRMLSSRLELTVSGPGG